MADIVDRAQRRHEAAMERWRDRRAAREAIEESRPSRHWCMECGQEIDEERRAAVPGVQYCVSCQEELEA